MTTADQLRAAKVPDLIYVRFSDDGENIRKWAREPFDGATAYANAGSGAPLGPYDSSEHYAPEHLPFALRDIAHNLYCKCEPHVLEDMVRIITDSAALLERLLASTGGQDRG